MGNIIVTHTSDKSHLGENGLHKIETICGVECYEKNGTAYLKLEAVARGLGFTQKKNGVEYVRWDRLESYLKELKFPTCGENDFIPENIFYRLAMKAKNETAEAFQAKVADEIIPSIRKHGGYISNSDMFVSMYFGELEEGQRIVIKTILDNVEEKQKQIATLNRENDVLAQKRLEWNERATINAVIRACGAVIGFEDAWREFKMELLYQHSINLNQRVTNYLNETGKKTKPKTLDMLHDDELPQALSTAVAMCRKHNVDISGILETKIQ